MFKNFAIKSYISNYLISYRGGGATKTFVGGADFELLVVGKIFSNFVYRVNRRGVRGTVIFDIYDSAYENLLKMFRSFYLFCAWICCNIPPFLL